MAGVFMVGISENFSFMRWSRGRPAVIRWLYDTACDEDADILRDTPVNMPCGSAWVQYRDGVARCAVIISSGTLASISQAACSDADRRALLLNFKKSSGYELAESLDDWEELWATAHRNYPRAHALLKSLGFQEHHDGIYRRCAAN